MPKLTIFHNNVWAEWKPLVNVTLVGLGDVCFQQNTHGTQDVQLYAGFMLPHPARWPLEQTPHQ